MKQVLNTNSVDRTLMALTWLTGQGALAWSSATSYLPGDIVMTSGNFLWRALQANTNHAPVIGSPYWTESDPNGERTAIFRDAIFLGPPLQYPQEVEPGQARDANFGAYPLVDSDAPISYSPAGSEITFQPFAVEKDKLSYTTGFAASSLSLSLYPRDSPAQYGKTPPYVRGDGSSFSESIAAPSPYPDPYAVISSNSVPSNQGNYLLQSMRQGFVQSDWYLAPVTLFRFIMPTLGDVTSYGAAVMFRGRVSELEVDRLAVKLTASSLMEIFKQKVPSQTIQPGNRWAPFNFNPTPDYIVAGTPTGSFNWFTLPITWSPSRPADGVLDEGWALIHVLDVGAWWRRIFRQTTVGSYNVTIEFLEPLPVALNTASLPSTVTVWAWKASDTGTNPSGPGAGFPYCPQPLCGIA